MNPDFKHETTNGSSRDALKSMTAKQQSPRRKNRLPIWQALITGLCAIAAVFACLEWLRPPSAGPEAAEPLPEEIIPVSEAAGLEAVKLKETPVAETAVPEPAAIPLPTPAPATPKPEATVEIKPVPATKRLDSESALRLVGMDARRDNAVNRDRELLAHTIDAKSWDAYRSLLGRSLKSGLSEVGRGAGVNRFDPVWNEPVLYQALLRWRTLGCFTESQIANKVFDDYTGRLLTWLLNHSEAMEEFLLTIRPGDDAPKVLKFLMDTWSANESDFTKYYPLALACAVVFDEPMTIPHPIGASSSYGAANHVDPLGRYLWYVEKNEKGKLAAPVHRSSARDLVWAVCAPVSTSELEWSLDKLHYRRKNWGNAYGKIEYLMERAVEGLNPYEEYSFAEILKEGGICGDQTYFCVNTARAQGIPAMGLSGETNNGPHAWAGLKIDSREWTTGIGRISGVSKGQALNPQTRRSVTEQEIQLWNDRYHQSPIATLSVWRHLWLADFLAAMKLAEENAEIIRLANQVGHSFTETWSALYALLKRDTKLTGDPPKPDNLDEWRAFARNMRQEFKDNPRMAQLAATAELEYIFPYVSEGDAKRILLRERRRIERDSGEQKDLIARSLKREAELIMKRGGPNAKRDISRLYDRALRDYGGSITGFKMMAEDYFSYFRNEDPELARKAARDIELAFKRVVETGTKDWFRAKTETSIYKMICRYYRQAGDPKRAEMLEKRYEVLMRRAKRSAL